MKKTLLLLLLSVVISVSSMAQEIGDWVIFHVAPHNVANNDNITWQPFWVARKPNVYDSIDGYVYGPPGFIFQLNGWTDLRKCHDQADAENPGECWATIQQSKDWGIADPGVPDASLYSTFSGDYDDLTDKPTLNISNWNTAFGWGNHASAGYLTSVPAQSFSSLTGKPTTLSGYGITDAYPLTGNPSGFLTVEVDGSTTNEIELPSQTGNSGRFLQTNGSSASWQVAITSEVDGSVTNEIQTISYNTGVISLSNSGGSVNVPGLNRFTSYSAGTAYNITTTPAKVDFGTTDPEITITTPGTYLIISNVRVDYNGLTNLAANTVTVKLRRTNNTAADLTSATGDFIVPPVTLLTATGGDCDVNAVIYTTSNSNDVIELQASRSGSISVGNIQAGNAWIVAVRIF
jgi:hypothetical protein